jgi:hypothetical protein
MWMTKPLFIAAAVAIALSAAGCKPEPVKPKVSEPKASTADTPILPDDPTARSAKK